MGLQQYVGSFGYMAKMFVSNIFSFPTEKMIPVLPLPLAQCTTCGKRNQISISITDNFPALGGKLSIMFIL